jgi:pyruvate,water dikinase
VKNASLGEMYRELSGQGVKVPNGFAITAEAYRHFLRTSGIEQVVEDSLRGLDTRDIASLRERGLRVRQTILRAPLPADLEDAVVGAYARLGGSQSPLDVAVRSSATAEDLPDASFAGQQETYLNVRGDQVLLESCRRCFASLFTDRAISYRADKGFDHRKIALSIGVQRMVRSDLACAGVMFSIDTETGFKNAVLINAAYGLGENVVQGSVNPDEYCVFKPTLAQGFRPILEKRLGTKEFKLVYDVGGSRMTRNVPVPQDARGRFALDDDILTLARWAVVVEKHYSSRRGRNGLEVYVMCEIPSNVILADQFSEVFDGFSIGSNDLTQLVLGVDRDSDIVAHVFDERNPAVKSMIANVIRTAKSQRYFDRKNQILDDLRRQLEPQLPTWTASSCS